MRLLRDVCEHPVIPFVDLQAQYRAIKHEVDEAVLALLDSTQFVLGREVAAFEEEFAAYCEGMHAVGTNSGTSALHLALLASGIGVGDEVITVAHTFVANAAVVHYVGARPIFVDIDPRSFGMEPARIEAAITPRTKALMPVHLYGQPVDLDPILQIAKRHDLRVIEDACQAHGARYKGRRVGALGDVGCFSFYPGKNLGACGEGGALVTHDPQIASVARQLRDWGQSRKYHHEMRGFNYRLEGIQAAILRVKLRHLDAWNAARRDHAAAYTRLLAGSAVKLPELSPHAEHVFHVYAVRTAARDGLQAHLHDRAVQTGIHYPIPVHLQKAYADPSFPPGSLPESEAAAAEVLSLPMFAELTTEQIDGVASAVRDFGGYDERPPRAR